jgi:hypothetical protein
MIAKLMIGATIPRNPESIGLRQVLFLAQMRAGVAALELNRPFITAALNLYNSLRCTNYLKLVWKDADYVLNRLGCPGIFNRPDAPSSWQACHSAARSVLRFQPDDDKTLLSPNPFMELVLDNATDANPDASRNLLKRLFDHLQYEPGASTLYPLRTKLSKLLKIC